MPLGPGRLTGLPPLCYFQFTSLHRCGCAETIGASGSILCSGKVSLKGLNQGRRISSRSWTMSKTVRATRKLFA